MPPRRWLPRACRAHRRLSRNQTPYHTRSSALSSSRGDLRVIIRSCEGTRCARCAAVLPAATLSNLGQHIGGCSMSRITFRTGLIALGTVWFLTVVLAVGRSPSANTFKPAQESAKSGNDDSDKRSQDPVKNAADKVRHGRSVFRFDTFGDQAFWGDTLRLHQAIEGAACGGVGPGVGPATALCRGTEGRHRHVAGSRARADRTGQIDLTIRP